MSNLTRRGFAGLLGGGAAAVAAPALVPGLFGAQAIEPEGWRRGFSNAPERLDSDLELLTGRLPDGLGGVLYRVGPGQFERAGERLGHWFDGDGMVQRFEVSGGRVRHRGRFVETDKRRNESEAGRFLYPGFGSSPREAGGFSRPDDINVANTSVLPLGEEIWALWEGGSPWRVDAHTVETLGRRAFDGSLDGLPFSAHPKRGPDGEIWNFGAFGNRCVLWHLSSGGEVLRTSVLALPAPSLMHDFAVTRSKIILLLPPLLHSGEPAGTVIDAYRWQPEQPLRVLVIDKSDFAISGHYELPARFLFHVGNAYEERGGTIRLDAFLAADAGFATHGARRLVAGDYVEEPEAIPAMITLYPGGEADIALHDGEGEFPQIDPRLVGERHDRLYGITTNGIGAWDWRAERFERHLYSPDHWSEEPVFVPRSAQSTPDEGWLVATALNGRAGRTELHVFDAAHVADGPVASLACPYALPLGFHGAFVSA